MKARRLGKKNFSVLVDREKVEQIEKMFEIQGKTKAAWLEEKIDGELKK